MQILHDRSYPIRRFFNGSYGGHLCYGRDLQSFLNQTFVIFPKLCAGQFGENVGPNILFFWNMSDLVQIKFLTKFFTFTRYFCSNVSLA